MRIVIFGANGQTGRLLTGQALAAGHDVAAVTRRPAEFPIRHDRLAVVEADVHDAPAVDRAVEGADVVLSALGVPYEDQAPGIFTSRAGLAASMLDQATDTRFVRKAAAVTTSEGAPSLFRMIRQEAFKKK